MNALVMASLGTLVGVGLVAAGASLRGVTLFPELQHSLLRSIERIERIWAWVLGALAAGAVALAVTRWPVAAVWAMAAVIATPFAAPRRRTASTEIAYVEAIATWAEQIRDTMSASAGLQQALVATARNGPTPIAEELAVFARRAPRGELGPALRQLGRDLEHPAADMVIAGLLAATELDAGRLVPLLSRLAASIRDEAQMRVRIEVGRARVRASMRIVGVCVTLTILLLVVAGGELLQGYGSWQGQLWLVVIGCVVVLAVWSSRKLAEIPQPERFTARRGVA